MHFYVALKARVETDDILMSTEIKKRNTNSMYGDIYETVSRSKEYILIIKTADCISSHLHLYISLKLC